jgi:hypothetical protein
MILCVKGFSPGGTAEYFDDLIVDSAMFFSVIPANPPSAEGIWFSYIVNSLRDPRLRGDDIFFTFWTTPTEYFAGSIYDSAMFFLSPFQGLKSFFDLFSTSCGGLSLLRSKKTLQLFLDFILLTFYFIRK